MLDDWEIAVSELAFVAAKVPFLDPTGSVTFRAGVPEALPHER
jgi:hypothetical protein